MSGGRSGSMFGVGTCVLALIWGCAESSRTLPAERPAGQPGRVGVYDSRAIAVAWAASAYNTRPRELLAAHREAKAAGDQVRVRQLEAEGSTLQDRLHRQGFGTEPVEDLLEPIQGRIRVLLPSMGIDRIVSKWNADAPRDGAIDVTDRLVAEYNPSARTLKTIQQLRATRPMTNSMIHAHAD